MSTSLFEATGRRGFCSVLGIDTYQKRILYCIEKVGGQSALARRLSERLGTHVNQQSISYLKKSNAKKPARGSRLTADIAAEAGVRAEWLSSGKGPRDVELRGGFGGENSRPAPQLWTEIDGVHYSPQALLVARALDVLPENRRDEYQQMIEVEALKYRSTRKDRNVPEPTNGTKKRPVR